jgi:hypothetical protein
MRLLTLAQIASLQNWLRSVQQDLKTSLLGIVNLLSFGCGRKRRPTRVLFPGFSQGSFRLFAYVLFASMHASMGHTKKYFELFLKPPCASLNAMAPMLSAKKTFMTAAAVVAIGR